MRDMESENLLLEKTVKKRNSRRLALILVIVAVILGALAYTGYYFYDDLFGALGIEVGPEVTLPYSLEPITEPEEPDPTFESLHDISDATNLNGFLKEWYHNGGEENIRYSKDVLNVLLVGMDENTDDGSTGRSDTMMLCSVNKKTHQITLVSFLRDSYAYMEIDGKEYYHRINSTLAFGGVQAVMDTISHLYKVRVDHYASVDFKSFPKLINALGGVTVQVEEREAKYINRTAPSMKNAFPFGDAVKLTGGQALVYSRIRKLDSDIERTVRQQKVIESIIQSAKTASLGQIYNAVDQTLPYVGTNYTKLQLTGLAAQAFTQGWMKYGMQKASYPILIGDHYNAVTGTISGMAILVVDYPLAAQQLQTALYGESNINLENDASRNAYIQQLFRGAQQQTRPRTTSPTTTAPNADWQDPALQNPDIPQETQPETEAPAETTRGGWWPFGGGNNNATEAPTEAPPEAPPEATNPQ